MTVVKFAYDNNTFDLTLKKKYIELVMYHLM